MNEIAEVKQQELANKLESKREVIKNTVAKGASDNELEMFMHLAKEYNLDPFQQEIFFWKYGSKDPTIMTSRDGYLKIANQNPNFEGLDSGAIYPGDSFKKTREGVEHELDISSISKQPVGAYAVVYRSDREIPVRVVAPFKDYKKDNKVWNNYPSAMIQKVAESMSLKRAFSVSGLVSKEEMDLEGQQEEIDVSGFTEEEYIKEERKAIQEESEQSHELSKRQLEVMETIDNGWFDNHDVIDFLQKKDAKGVDELSEEDYKKLFDELSDKEDSITEQQRKKIFAIINELPNDREYYMKQFGIDSLSEDGCTEYEANKFIEYLDKQQKPF